MRQALTDFENPVEKMPWDASALGPLMFKDSVLESSIEEEKIPVCTLFVVILVEFLYRVFFDVLYTK